MIDGAIQMMVGVLVTLVGYGVIQLPMKPGGDGAGWMRRHGRWFRIAGPLLIAIGTALVLADPAVGLIPR